MASKKPLEYFIRLMMELAGSMPDNAANAMNATKMEKNIQFEAGIPVHLLRVTPMAMIINPEYIGRWTAASPIDSTRNPCVIIMNSHRPNP